MALCDDYHIPHSAFLSWEPEDRAKALAFRYEKAERCTMCGTAPWEWKQNKYAYMTEEHHCHGCYMKHMASETDSKRMPGTTIELVRTTPQRLAQQRIMLERRRNLSKKAAREKE